MLPKRKLLIFVLLSCFLPSLISNFCLVFAQNPHLSLEISGEKEVSILKGDQWVKETIPIQDSKPGDILLYTIAYRNESKEEAKDATIVDPIPEGTVYILDSAEGEETEITYSIDEGKTYQAPPVTYITKKPDGSEEKNVAPPKMYTHIKWLIKKSVLPGESGKVRFKVEIE